MSNDTPTPPPQNPYAAPVASAPPTPPKGSPPKTYLPEAIFCLVCCGGIFAIPAIVFAAQVNSKFNTGDYEGAQKASNNAKLWCIIAVVIGVIVNALVIAIQFFTIGLSA